VEVFHDFMVNVSLMRAKAAGEATWNVQELVDDRFLFLLFRQLVIVFRYDFNHIRRRKMKSLLPDFAESMHSGDYPLRSGALASDAEHELRYDMEKS